MQVHLDLHFSLKSTLRVGEISYADEILPDEIAVAKGGFHFTACRSTRFHPCCARISSRRRRDFIQSRICRALCVRGRRAARFSGATLSPDTTNHARVKKASTFSFFRSIVYNYTKNAQRLGADLLDTELWAIHRLFKRGENLVNGCEVIHVTPPLKLLASHYPQAINLLSGNPSR